MLVKESLDHPSNEGLESAEQVHRRKEEDYWLWTKAAAIVAAVGAVVAAAFAGGAFYQALRQADAAEDANRPWIAVKGLADITLNITDREITVKSEIKFKNIGRSPAQNLAWNFIITTNKDDSFGSAAGKDICIEQKRGRSLFYLEDVVFPDTGEQRRGGITLREVGNLIEVNEKHLRNLLDRSVNRNERAAKAAPFVLRYEMPLEIRGCITYLSTEGDRSVHATSFAYAIAAKTLSKSGLPFDISVLGVRQKTDLTISPTDDGVYAD